MRDRCDHDLRVGKVDKSAPKLARRTEAKPKRIEKGAALQHVNMCGWPLPGKTQNVTPLPPVGRDPLAWMSIRVTKGGNETNVMPPMGLAPI